MKKFKKTIALLLCTSCLLTGCGDPLKGIAENTVYVQKDSRVRSVSIESFDKDYYKEEELKTFIEEEVKAQQQKLGEKSVSIETFAIKDNKAQLYLSYEGIADYVEFTDTELKTGSGIPTLSDGMKLVDVQTREDVTDKMEHTDSLHYIKIQDPQDIQVLVDGKVLYCSENVQYKEKNLVNVPAGEEAFLLYK